MHKLTTLEARVLDSLVGHYFSSPAEVLEPRSRIVFLTEAIKICVYNATILADLPAGDPAFERFYNETSAYRKCANLLARSLTENPRDFALHIDAQRAMAYSLDSRTKHKDRLEFLTELAAITGCRLVRNTIDAHAGLPWNENCCWLIPSSETDMTILIDFLRSENIPFEFEARSLLEAFLNRPTDSTDHVQVAP